MKYRIEVRMYGVVACALDTDDYRQARIFYRRHNELEDRWTRLYIDGESGTKAWIDRQMRHTPNLTAYFRKDR